MLKRLLLVDDEKFFLKSLKDGLSSLSDIFEIDICHSVNTAIKNIVTHHYDLVVTDIRMPGKTGIDLLAYLRDVRFKGDVIVMSAYNNEETIQNIKDLGGVDVISKPFKLEWFKNMLLERFSGESPGAEQAVTFEGISLVTVMQIINLEKKTSALEINIEGCPGMIYFVDGEIIHAEFDDLEGKEALIRLIVLDSGVITVKNIREKIPRTIEIPFENYIMNIMKTLDERRKELGITMGEPDEPGDDDDQSPEVDPSIDEILKQLTEVRGYRGAAVLNAHGQLLAENSKIPGVRFNETAPVIHRTIKISKKMCKENGLGDLDMIRFYTKTGTFFSHCYKDKDSHFHTILVTKTDTNVLMAALKLEKVAKALSTVI
ncbi:MAG: response regulator [bacterium]|nr:response regulator [bacterium]